MHKVMRGIHFFCLLVFSSNIIIQGAPYQPIDLAFLAMLQRENPYQRTIAQVKTDSALSSEEQQFLDTRAAVAKKSVEKIVGRSVKNSQIPRIAVVGSGGGYRAMISLIGFLAGAADAGLLDLVSYVSGVSGSTWAIMPWVASGKSIKDFQKELFPTLDYGLVGVVEAQDMNGIILNLMKKWMFKQCITLVDIYGALLANNVVLDNKQGMFLHQTLARRLSDGKFPLPIGCALGGDNKKPYHWFEFSPFEIGSVELNAYIPTWSFGRAFKNGCSVDFAPEQSLGYFLGIFGSAFAECDSEGLIKLLVDKLLEKKQVLLSKIVACLAQDIANNKDIGGGVVNNFMYGLPRPLQNAKELSFIDAGIAYDEAEGVGSTLALLPSLRAGRAADMIIVVDASECFEHAIELRRAVEYVQKLGFVMPEINYEHAEQSSMSVFGDMHNAQVPLIVYMPNIKNEDYSATFDPRLCAQQGYCSYLNFMYTQEQAYELSGLVASNVKRNRDVFYQMIRDIVVRKSRK